MSAPTIPPLEVVAAMFDAKRGRIRFELNRDPRVASQAPSMFYPRDLRGGIDVYAVEQRLLEVLRYIMVDSLSAFFAAFESEEDGATFLALTIAPPDEVNRYGIISSGNHLIHALSELLEIPAQVDYVRVFGTLTDPGSSRHIGFNLALTQIGGSIVHEVIGLLNIAFSRATLPPRSRD